MKVESGSNYFKGLSRRDYIQKAHEIIEREGSEAVSIRRLAAEMGCSSALLYRYFSDRQELLYYAQLPTLRGYIKRLNKAEKTWNNIWDVYVGVWYCYSQEAFRHPEAYDILFFGSAEIKLGHAIKEYYGMFPEDIEDTNELFQEMLKTSKFESRDMVVCKKCIREGVITPENAEKLNRMNCMLYAGYLKNILDHKGEEIDIEKHVRLFVNDVDSIVRMLAGDLCGYRNYAQN